MTAQHHEQNLRLVSREIYALNGGLFVCPGFGRHGERVIDSYELIFVRRGELAMREEDREFVVKTGQTLLLWPGRHHGGMADYPRDLEFYWIHFRIASSARARRSVRRGSLTVPQLATPARPERLTELFHQFLHDQEAGGMPPLQGDLLMMLMLCETSRTVASPGDSAAAALAARAEHYIAAHFHESIHAAQIAAQLECNADYLGRVYLKNFGQTLTQAIQNYRVQFAKKLLRESPLSIEQIVARCGFADPAYFRRIFHRLTGVTPGEFRKLHSRVHINLG